MSSTQATSSTPSSVGGLKITALWGVWTTTSPSPLPVCERLSVQWQTEQVSFDNPGERSSDEQR